MGDIAYGRYEAHQKRDAVQAYQKMSHAKKDSFRQKMVEIAKADAGDGQSLPTSPAPV